MYVAPLLLMVTSIASSVLAYVQPIRSSFVFSSLAMSIHQPDTSHPYHPPSWAANVLKNVPEHGRLHLANLPTPIHLISNKSIPSKDGILSRLKELDIKLYIKRDDATGGTELGGNKVRKLEFLLSDALAKECDAVVTIGGEQS